MKQQYKLVSNLKIVRYFFVGGSAAIVDNTIFYVFVKIFYFNYFIIGTIGFIIATYVNYFLGVKFVFNYSAKFSRKMEIMTIYVISGIGLILHLTILYFCIEVFFFEKMLSKITATGLVFFWNYLARKNFVYIRS